MTHIQVITPKYDPNYYKQHIRIAIGMTKPTESKLTKLALLVQRAYEQGIDEGKRQMGLYDEFTKS